MKVEGTINVKANVTHDGNKVTIDLELDANNITGAGTERFLSTLIEAIVEETGKGGYGPVCTALMTSAEAIVATLPKERREKAYGFFREHVEEIAAKREELGEAADDMTPFQVAEASEKQASGDVADLLSRIMRGAPKH